MSTVESPFCIRWASLIWPVRRVVTRRVVRRTTLIRLQPPIESAPVETMVTVHGAATAAARTVARIATGAACHVSILIAMHATAHMAQYHTACSLKHASKRVILS